MASRLVLRRRSENRAALGLQVFGDGVGRGCGLIDFNLEEIGNWVRERLSEVQRHERERRADGKPCG